MIIQYTIGLVLPWWVIDIINRNMIEGYGSNFSSYSKFNRWVIGLILPWWVPVLLENDRKMKITAFDKDETDSLSDLNHGMCSNHPHGAYGGYHAIYESPECNRYYCIYCGGSSPNLNILTAGSCTFHPNGQRSHRQVLAERKSSEKEVEILV